MKILITTVNKDRFRVMKYLLSNTVFTEDAEFYSLYDIEEIPAKRRWGNIKQRSLEKANNIYNNISNNIFDYIVGVDDGLRIVGKVITEVRTYTKDILNNNFLRDGQKIDLVTGYSFIDKNGNTKTVVTNIPYVYSVNYDYKMEDYTFPLYQVFMPLNVEMPVSMVNEKDALEYELSYAKEPLMEVVTYYDELYKEK